MKTYYPLIIIGAGITGLSTTLAWKKAYPEKNVLIIEKNMIDEYPEDERSIQSFFR